MSKNQWARTIRIIITMVVLGTMGGSTYFIAIRPIMEILND